LSNREEIFDERGRKQNITECKGGGGGDKGASACVCDWQKATVANDNLDNLRRRCRRAQRVEITRV
jgi:hypothetical protein